MTSKQIGLRGGRPVLRGVLLSTLTLAVAALATAAAGETPPQAAEAVVPVPGAEPAAPSEARVQPPERRGRDRPPSLRRESARSARPPFDRPRSTRRMAAQLDLSQEQRDQLRQTAREIGDDRRIARRRVADARRALYRAARNPESASSEVQELGAELGRAQADALLARRSDWDRILGILTDEQREQLAARRAERAERREGADNRRRDRSRARGRNRRGF